MEIGIGVFPHEAYRSTQSLLDICQQIEGSGFDRLWLADSQGIWPDPFVLLGLLAEKTKRIGLGVGVSNPRTRHPAVLARASVTLAHLSHNRFLLGIGAGNTSLLHLGLSPGGVELCEDALQCVRSLVQGKEGSFGGSPVPAFKDEEQASVPVCLAANGPRMLALAGAVADGAIVSSGISREILGWVWGNLDGGLERSQKKRKDFQLIVFVGCAVSADRKRARREILSWISRRLSMPLPEEVSGIPESDRLRALGAYNYNEHYRTTASHSGVVDVIPDEWIDRFGVAGTPDECAERIAGLAALGVDAVFILPMTDDSETFASTFARDILPRIRG